MSPAKWIVAEFIKAWGTTVTRATLFDIDDAPESVILTEWDEQLERFPPAVLRDAVQAAKDSGSAFPPRLPEFKALCRQYNRPEHQEAPKAITNGGGHATEAGRAQLAKIKAMLAGTYKEIT